MESSAMRHGVHRAIAACRRTPKRRSLHSSTRRLATPAQGETIRAAAPIRFSSDRNQFSRSRPQAQFIDDNDASSFRRGGGNERSDARRLLRSIRIVPASPSYFTAVPKMTDDMLFLSHLLRKYQTLPVLPKGEAPYVAWKTREQYKTEHLEPIRQKDYDMIVLLLRRLNCIHPSLIPAEVTQALERYKRLVQPHLNKPKPIEIDQYGRARAIGRRKTSTAAVYLVEGEGNCLINNKSLTSYFGRLHHRESSLWPLKATERLDKYNVWALVKGGGLTGQAEAITLGLAKALLAHEPDLKPALRRAGVLTRDPRKVERKKPGKLKARKMPAWVKR